MRALVICAALAFALVSASAVVDTTDATFDEVTKGSLVLMEFYAPWCGHCKKLEPEWDKAAQELAGTDATLAKLDATVEKASAQKFNIGGFPTIKVFRNGEVSGDYEGGRTAPEIVKWVKANSGPAVRIVASADELETLKKENPVVVTLFSEGPTGARNEAFESAANKMRSDYIFAIVNDASIAQANGASQGDLVVFKTFDDKKETFSGEDTVAAVSAFIRSAGSPLFDQIGPHNYKGYVERDLPLFWVFATEKDSAVLDAAREAAPAFKGKVVFTWIDSSKYAGMAQRLGLAGDKFPAAVIDYKNAHFAIPSDQELTKDVFTNWAQKYLNKELEQTKRTENAPAEHTVAGLTTLVGSTFQELVEDADTDVFVEFYAPWCGHCKQLTPVFEAVAKTLESEPVRIAKIDATANDYPEAKFPVQGFPTMFWVPKGTRKPVVYEGGRTEEALTSWIKERIGKE
jgi:protein disulfide-isomerase A1